ncbi:MAG: DUF1353 domain-containing protein [Chthoniobacterales bacterium]
MATTRANQPAWQRNPLFQFFASLKLAVVLLAVLIVGAIAGTLYESTFDAKVARAYIYGASWFNVWLVLLATNLAVSALSRWPWRKHHVAFLVTHLGIITLLAGAMIGRLFGIEGTMTLFKGEPPNNKLLVDEHQLRVRDSDGIVKGYRAEFIHRPPTAQKPLDLGTLASGARLSVIEYAPAIDSKLNPRSLPSGGAPALHFTIATQMMGQKLESWLLADDQQHGTFNMGLANITLKRGVAPSPNPSATAPTNTGEVDIEESIFAFANAPDQQIGKSVKGGSTGAKLQFSKEGLTVNVAGKAATLDVAGSLGKDVPIEGTPFVAHLQNYWPDFRIQDGKPTSITDQPNNPAVLVTLRGRAIPVEPARDAHSGAPEMPNGGGATANHLTLFIADDGSISYELASRKAGTSTGKLELNKPLPTGWADWQLTADRLLPHAEEWMDFIPVTQPVGKSELPDGVRIRVQQGSQTFEQWVPAGWQITVPVSPQEVQVAYGWKQIPLPVGLELRDFEVQRNEGSDSPAGFKSTVRVSTPEGENATGHCWMNHPFNFPGAMWNTWTGLTFKMSQASWNPENLSQSTIQILRDPGWLLKWIGSLLIVSGVFMLFYVKKFRRPIGGAANKPSRPQTREAVVAAVLIMFAATLAGCASHSTPWTALAKQQHQWGYYIGVVDTRWNSDGRTMTLLNELRYVDPKGETWIAPAGSVVDGASIPRPLWPFMGGPFEGRYRNASVLHDVSYDKKNRPPEECDRMFYNAMRCSGVSASEAKTMYWALLHFGHHWKFGVKKAKPAKVTDIAAQIAPSLNPPTGEAPRPTAVNPDDVNAIRDWIRKNDPSMEQIESQAQEGR